jgi:predicted nucleic acid-binding protein
MAIVLPLSDVTIACAAMRIGAVILNRDSHFARIPGLHVCKDIV